MIPPHNSAAEADLLGAALDFSDARTEILSRVHTEDFYVPAHRQTFAAISGVVAKGQPVNLTTVATELHAQGSDVGRERLVGWSVNHPLSWSVQVGMVVECAARRRLMAEAHTLMNLAGDPSVPFDATASSLDHLPERVAAPSVERIEAPEITTLTGEPEREWVFPETLRRRERVSIVARGGVGKSVLGFTSAIFASAGVHLFTHASCPAVPSLVVDLENEARDIGDAAKWIAGSVGKRYQGGCHAMSRPQGIDLLEVRDQRWLESLIAFHEPGLVVVGPLYKMFRGQDAKSKSSEEAAETVAAVLDDLRVKYDCALWIENHPPHSEDRTRGSSLWDGWFPFSFFAKRVDKLTVELKPTRGMRFRNRQWPWGIREGQKGELPWVPVWTR